MSKLAGFIIGLMEENEYLATHIDYDKFCFFEQMQSSIVDSIYWYGIQFPKFFITKLLPIIKEQLSLLRIVTNLGRNPPIDFIENKLKE
jgi:hypothetical protein